MLEIEVKEPVSRADKAVLNLIRNSSHQAYFFTGSRYEQIKPLLETIATRYPNSAYATNSVYLLGESHFADEESLPALNYLTRLENDTEFILLDKMRRFIAEIRCRLAAVERNPSIPQ
jgi:hypothetical protein